MVQLHAGCKNKAGTRAVIVSDWMDFPIVILFLFTGILYVFYQYNPAALPADTPNAAYSLTSSFMNSPAESAGAYCRVAWVTAMGSRPQRSTPGNHRHEGLVPGHLQAGRHGDASCSSACGWGTVGFFPAAHYGGAYRHGLVRSASSEVRIIQIALGIFGYTYGSLLGIFLLGMLTALGAT